MPNPEQGFDEVVWARELVTRIVQECPRRVATGEDERRAHALIAEEMSALGLAIETHRFRWHDNGYANLALHFGLGALGSLVGPWLGLLLHAGAAASYALDSSRKAFVLRKLFRFGESQNVLGTIAARKPLRRRVVFHAHADAAFTGLLFRPELAQVSAKPGSPLYKSLRVATGALAGLAALDAVQLIAGKWRLLSLARAVLTVPPLIGFALNLDVVLRRQTVPGAMDNLSGVAGMLLLARRLAGRVPEDVEVVFVATGAEEAMLGGSQSLARDKRGVWDPKQTVVIGLDGLANGELRYFVEGEIFPVPLASWLRAAVEQVAASDRRFAEVAAYEIPVGGTDSVPFAVRGYDAVTLGCVDPKAGMPREYHLPSDTPENLEADKIPYCVDFAERLFERVVG
jgi:hypothetical protein